MVVLLKQRLGAAHEVVDAARVALLEVLLELLADLNGLSAVEVALVDP